MSCMLPDLCRAYQGEGASEIKNNSKPWFRQLD